MAESKTSESHIAAPSSEPVSDDFPDRTTIERRIIRRLDFRVIPLLGVLFLVSFVDRGNIGNAHIQGMDKSLHLVGNNYNIAVMVFTLAYIVFGLPASVMFKRFGPKSLPTMMFIWGKIFEVCLAKMTDLC